MGEEWYRDNHMYADYAMASDAPYIENSKNNAQAASVDQRNGGDALASTSMYSQCYYPSTPGLYSHNTNGYYSDQIGYSPYQPSDGHVMVAKNDCYPNESYYDAFDYSKYANYPKYAVNINNNNNNSNNNVLQSITSRLCPKVHRKNSQKNSDVKVTLENKKLFERFSKFGTEMIITKTGRRMFPSPQVSVQGLEATTKYFILFDMLPADEHRYKYHHFKWVVAGRAEPLPPARFYIHPECPLTGSQWMKQQIIFHKVKLTNNTCDQRGNIVLNSMHRYIPRVHVVQASELYNLQNQHFDTFSFKECTFTAVTAYQNAQVTQLKIEHNPFAKGFRKPEKEKREKKKELSSKTECPDKTEPSAKTFQELCERNAKTYEEKDISYEEKSLETKKAPWPLATDPSQRSLAYLPAYNNERNDSNDSSNNRNDVNNNENNTVHNIRHQTNDVNPVVQSPTQYADKNGTVEHFDFQRYHINAAAYGIFDQIKPFPQSAAYTNVPYRANGPSFI